jgi:hypothetical protein
VRAIHLAHPAGSQESLQFVPTESGPGVIVTGDGGRQIIDTETVA